MLGLGLGVSNHRSVLQKPFHIISGFLPIGSGNESGLNYYDMQLTAASGSISWPQGWISVLQDDTVNIISNASVKSGTVTFSSLIAQEADSLFGYLDNLSVNPTIGTGSLLTNQYTANILLTNPSVAYTKAIWYVEGTATTTVIRFYFGSVTITSVPGFDYLLGADGAYLLGADGEYLLGAG